MSNPPPSYPTRRHHDLLAWQEAILLVKEIYKLTEHFPSHELYGLTSQIRRAAISIPSNIAEGAARKGNNEFHHFLTISRGSLSELETQLIISKELGYIPDITQIMAQVNKLFGLVGGLINSIQKRKTL
jgi:four helix bundle protein